MELSAEEAVRQVKVILDDPDEAKLERIREVVDQVDRPPWPPFAGK